MQELSEVQFALCAAGWTSGLLCSYEFVYKQAVESTDAFLGMMNKDPSSTCCEDLQLRVDLPKSKSLAGTATTLGKCTLPANMYIA